MDEPFELVAKFDVGATYCESDNTYNVVHNLVETLLEGRCDVYVHKESSSLGGDNVLPNPLDQSHVSPTCL